MPWESRPVVLSASQRHELKRIAKDDLSPGKEKLRALIILLLAEGLKNKDIAARLSVHENTVVKWRGRWTGENSDATVSDSGESAGRPRHVLTEDLLDRIKILVNTAPESKQRWTVRLLAKEIEIPVSTMQRALVELDINLVLQSGTYD